MKSRKHFIIVIIIVMIVAIGCKSKENVESIHFIDNFNTDSLTLLERIYEDIDGDGDDESIELYTSAKIAPDGMMGWDTGHHWTLLVRTGEKIFPVFDDWIQHGELQFWIVTFNENNSKNTNSRSKIYAMITTSYGFEILSYYWDERSLSYKKEFAINPNNQWFVRHSYKYTMPDLTRIEKLN